MSERKSVLLRLDSAVHDALSKWAADELRSTNAQIDFVLRQALARWAADELRSTNAQIDFVLRQALARAGRLPPDARPPRPPGRPRSDE